MIYQHTVKRLTGAILDWGIYRELGGGRRVLVALAIDESTAGIIAAALTGEQLEPND